MIQASEVTQTPLTNLNQEQLGSRGNTGGPQLGCIEGNTEDDDPTDDDSTSSRLCSSAFKRPTTQLQIGLLLNGLIALKAIAKNLPREVFAANETITSPEPEELTGHVASKKLLRAGDKSQDHDQVSFDSLSRDLFRQERSADPSFLCEGSLNYNKAATRDETIRESNDRSVSGEQRQEDGTLGKRDSPHPKSNRPRGVRKLSFDDRSHLQSNRDYSIFFSHSEPQNAIDQGDYQKRDLSPAQQLNERTTEPSFSSSARESDLKHAQTETIPKVSAFCPAGW